jgi:MFS family permease
VATTRVTTDVAAVQAATVRALVLSQAVGALGITIGLATASLLARDLSGSESLAGLAGTFQVLGAAVASYLLARLMSARGRRVGIATGLLLGATGALLAVAAGVIGSMLLLLVGALLIGATTSANNAARYAATDLASADRRGRALSTVVWATTVGAVVGPNLTGPSAAFADLLGIPELTGPFALGAIGMLVAAVIVSVRLRPDPLLLARQLAERPVTPPTGTSWGRARVALREQPGLGIAVAGLAAAHAAMVGVMTMTPIHMEHGGAELRVIGVVISVHVLGMFAFSPLVGLLCDRVGRPPVLAAGGLVLLVALVLCSAAPEGTSWQIFSGLFLLGLGWSLAMVSASTMVADLAPLDARTDVQGLSDVLMGVSAASAGGLAGLLVGLFGYPVLALVTTVLAVGVVVAAWAAPGQPPEGAAP